MNDSNTSAGSKNTLKFVLMSIFGAFMFLIPLPDGEGAFNIPLGYVLEWVGGHINSVEVNAFGLIYLLTGITITISVLLTLLAYTVKPAFIMESERLKGIFICHPVYLISRLFALVVVWMVYFSAGPEWLVGWDGGRLIMMLLSGDSGLMVIFLVLGFLIPVLTDFGLMEFAGMLIKKIIRIVFTLPGRASIDVMASWFSSSVAGVLITRGQHEKGYYTDREAAVIVTNFCFVSLPFTFVVAGTIGLIPHFGLFYLVICIVCLFLALLMPRIWPLSRIRDDFLPDVGKQIDEEADPGTSLISQAFTQATTRAGQSTLLTVTKSGSGNLVSLYMDVVPVIMAWGTIALVLNFQTPIFQWLSLPFAHILNIFGVEGAFAYAPATVVGFVDMFIPALLLGDTAPLETRFILGVLSIVQLIYMAETGVVILKSRMPLNIGHLAVIFIMRTIISLPIIILLTRLLFNP